MIIESLLFLVFRETPEDVMLSPPPDRCQITVPVFNKKSASDISALKYLNRSFANIFLFAPFYIDTPVRLAYSFLSRFRCPIPKEMACSS
jgi:hypothetical protein